MKKVWVLERKFTEEDKELIEELKKEHPEVVRKDKDYYEVVKTANYYQFCSKVKWEFKRADKFAIDNLKKEMNPTGEKIPYNVSMNEKYAEVHNKTRDSYRVIQGEVDDDVKDYTTYKFVKECEPLRNFLWNDKNMMKQK